MHRAFTSTAILTTVITLAGCASLTPAKRPAYTGVDSVSSAQASQLVGVWDVTTLNPYPDAEPVDTVIEYRADGAVLGTIIPEGESADTLGKMTFEMTGQWSLENDTVTHENMEMNVITEDGNKMANLLGKMMGKRQGLSGQANIYELSADRVVLVGEDGGAMEYVRQ